MMNAKINWRALGEFVVTKAVELLQNEVQTIASEMAELRALGDKLGVPYVPGENVEEYRKRVVAARDGRK